MKLRTGEGERESEKNYFFLWCVWLILLTVVEKKLLSEVLFSWVN